MLVSLDSLKLGNYSKVVADSVDVYKKCDELWDRQEYVDEIEGEYCDSDYAMINESLY